MSDAELTWARAQAEHEHVLTRNELMNYGQTQEENRAIADAATSIGIATGILSPEEATWLEALDQDPEVQAKFGEREFTQALATLSVTGSIIRAIDAARGQ